MYINQVCKKLEADDYLMRRENPDNNYLIGNYPTGKVFSNTRCKNSIAESDMIKKPKKYSSNQNEPYSDRNLNPNDSRTIYSWITLLSFPAL